MAQARLLNAAAAPHLRVVAAVPDWPYQGQLVVRPRAWLSTLPGADALQTVTAEKIPGTGRRCVPKRDPIPDGGWAG